MEKITMYKAKNGTIHSTEDSAKLEDSVLVAMQTIEALLPVVPNDCSFHNGSGYFKCNPDNIETAKKAFLAIANSYFKPSEPFLHVGGIVGRYISDSGSQAFNTVLHKLSCIDDQYRMWGQIYYRLNPGEATHKQLN